MDDILSGDGWYETPHEEKLAVIDELLLELKELRERVVQDQGDVE